MAGMAGVSLPAWAQPEAARRVALVIGNNRYASAPLLNPVNDARAMASALQGAGFSVILKTDAGQGELLAALRDFGNRLKDGGPGTAGLFYFAGHGMQVKGRNFLVPIGANIEHEDELAYQALDAQAVMDKMESAGNGTNIVILDACRNNPFVRSFRSGRQGLAQMDAPVGTLVAFSTAPGSVASDGLQGGSNGLYTSHLLSAVQRPGLKVEEVFKQVRAAVLRDSQHRQVPWEASSLVGDFYFRPPVEGQAAGAPLSAALPDATSAIDEALWSAVKDSTSSVELFAYLNRFPAGRYARDARLRLADLVAPAAGPVRPAAAGPAPAAVSRPMSDSEIDAVLRQSEQGEREAQASIAAAQQRIDEIVTWGDAGTDRRPAKARRNAHDFAEGDRYRYRILDQITERYTRDHLWRIDRIEPDGSLWINDGAQRFDALGQARGGSDEFTGLWVDWQPALPLAAVASMTPSASPLEHGVASTVQWRNAQGRLTRAALKGKLHGPTAETIQTLSGLMKTRRIDGYLAGPAVRSDGERLNFTLNLAWWFAPGVGLPVRWSVEEREDDRLTRRTLHDVTALDVLSQRTAAPSTPP